MICRLPRRSRCWQRRRGDFSVRRRRRSSRTSGSSGASSAQTNASGSPEAAAALAQLAVHPALPEPARLLALRTLEHFAEPPPIDPTTGLWRPLPTRDKEPIKKAIAPTIQPLLATASGAPTAAALRVAGVFGLPVGESSLAAWAADERQPLALRLAAVERLGSMVRPLLDTATPEVRAAAARRWVTLQPDDIDTALRILLAHDTFDRSPNGLRIDGLERQPRGARRARRGA